MSRVLVSCRPEQLSQVRSRDFDIELKFDWEHEELLRGERSLEGFFEENGLDPGRVGSVHLPPGLGRGGGGVEMALTERNRGTINGFVHDQLSFVPEAYLVAHPPKDFEYTEQLHLISSLLEVTGREFAVENTSVESDWFTPEAIAFFAFVGAEYDRLDGLYLTLDSAHLPQEGCGPGVDRSAVDELESRLDGVGLPAGFREELDQGLDRVESYLPEDLTREDASTSPYYPLLKTLCLTGGRVKEVHLNDPVTDEVPELGSRDRPLLDPVLRCVTEFGVSVTVEPESLSDQVFDRVRDLQSTL